MPSMTPSLWWTFEKNNRGTAAPVRARLAEFCAETELHARFLNMLSLLEHIGSRKIMNSPAMNAPGLDGLKHLAEEARHAVFFKRLAERMASRSLDYAPADTFVASSARLYMARLDAEICQTVGRATALAYLYMSLTVELRAVWLYRIYQDVLLEQNAGVTLKGILGEEELHLREMVARLSGLDPQVEERMTQFCAFEETRFRHLWSEIEQESVTRRLAAE
jgi:hypothetical protein